MEIRFIKLRAIKELLNSNTCWNCKRKKECWDYNNSFGGSSRVEKCTAKR